VVVVVCSLGGTEHPANSISDRIAITSFIVDLILVQRSIVLEIDTRPGPTASSVRTHSMSLTVSVGCELAIGCALGFTCALDSAFAY